MQATTLSPEHAHKPRVFGIVLIAGLLALAGFLLVTHFAQAELARDLRTWQDKLNLIADSREGAVEEWVGRHGEELKKLAANPSLQMYFAELMVQPEPAEGAEPAQRSYLRNLLMFTADRLGLAPQNLPLSTQIPTQIPYSSPSGLAVLNKSGQMIVSTPFLDKLDDFTVQSLQKLPANAAGLIDLHKSEGGKPLLGFAVPVFPIQSDPATAEPVGRIVGVKEADESLFSLLKHPGIVEKTMEAVLVRRDGDNLTYLSPLMDGSAPFEKQAQTNDRLAEGLAVAAPQSFVEKQDYAGHEVLATARPIAGTPWQLVLKIDRKEALAVSDARRGSMLTILWLAVAFTVALVVAVWYMASSRRSLFASKHFREMAERESALSQLLQLVTENQPESVYILDSEHRFRFANPRAGDSAGMDAKEMDGKKIADVLGAARAKEIIAACDEVLKQGHAQSRIRRMNEDGEEIIVKAEYVPLEEVPAVGIGGGPALESAIPGVLVVEQDVSEVVHERERRIRANRQLIDTLVMLVDKRDPHAANHSQLVSELAHEVAEAMELDSVTAETARVAGLLMNIGKIVIPEDVLTKRDSLNEKELRSVRDSMSASAALLRHISFEGPVVECLREAQEHWDGTGPKGLKEEGILMSARIVAAANAFIGMISLRSWRPAMSIDEATKQLLETGDTQFDRKVVVALVNFIENGGGREWLEQWRVEKRGAA